MLSRKDKKGTEAIASISFDRDDDTILLLLLGCNSLIAALLVLHPAGIY
jgi:hypothetical protein